MTTASTTSARDTGHTGHTRNDPGVRDVRDVRDVGEEADVRDTHETRDAPGVRGEPAVREESGVRDLREESEVRDQPDTRDPRDMREESEARDARDIPDAAVARDDLNYESRHAGPALAAEQPIGLCLDCGYALHGLPTPRCPECGREFDPLDPKTMNMGRELSELAKFVLGPVRWPVSVMSWGAIAVALWYARLPGGQLKDSSSIWILIGLGVLWIAWPIVRWIAARQYGWPTSLLMRGQRLRLAVGVSILLAAAAIWYQLPLKAALYVSRPAMDRLATELLASGQQYADDRWCGVYKATRVGVIPTPGNPRGGVRITVEESNRAYRSGFVYLPHADTRRNYGRGYQHVGGGWWAWRQEG